MQNILASSSKLFHETNSQHLLKRLLFFSFYCFLTPLRVFPTSLSRWFLIEISVTANLLVSRTLLSILADLNNVVVWIVSTRPLISQSSSPFTNPLVTVPRVPIIIVITVTFMFHGFSQFPNKGRNTNPSFHFLSVLLRGQSGQ